MITSILNRETCKLCQICCRYNDSDVWDAPGFTGKELERALTHVSSPIYEERGLFFFRMKKENDQYTCPLLTKTGCCLGTEKPFKCAIWPLYVVHFHNRLALVVSDECPSIFRFSNEEILDGLGETIERIKTTVSNSPELVEPMREHFRFICFFD